MRLDGWTRQSIARRVLLRPWLGVGARRLGAIVALVRYWRSDDEAFFREAAAFDQKMRAMLTDPLVLRRFAPLVRSDQFHYACDDHPQKRWG
jgi:hypothetical protein